MQSGLRVVHRFIRVWFLQYDQRAGMSIRKVLRHIQNIKLVSFGSYPREDEQTKVQTACASKPLDGLKVSPLGLVLKGANPYREKLCEIRIQETEYTFLDKPNLSAYWQRVGDGPITRPRRILFICLHRSDRSRSPVAPFSSNSRIQRIEIDLQHHATFSSARCQTCHIPRLRN